jgi:microcystin-dependent protein
MSEPVTVNKTLIVPNTGDLVAAWGTSALNPNFQLIDAMFGGVTTISLSSTTTILLTSPATTGIWGGFVPQASNCVIRFTGAQTGSATIQFTLPGFYIIDNQCTGTTFVQLAPFTGGGNKIGARQGCKTHVFFDGTSLDFANPPDPGSALDLHGATALPPWMTACTVQPYLVKDGSVYTSSVYPALANMLGSTFGGNGVTTFGVPDERARARIALDTIQALSSSTSARLTAGGAGFNANVMGTSGGSQFTQAHTHGVTDPGHTHTNNAQQENTAGSVTGGGGASYPGPNPATINSAFTGITINSAGAGNSQNVPPAIVSFLPLIKT